MGRKEGEETMSEKCNHILGQCTCKILDQETKEIIVTWSSFIYANEYRYDIKTGMINLSKIDKVFQFCPSCGVKLPEPYCGMGASDD